MIRDQFGLSLEQEVNRAHLSPMLLPHIAIDNQYFVRSAVNYGLYIHNTPGFPIGQSGGSLDSRPE